MPCVFVDFDGTLTRFDSFVPYCFVALLHRPWRISGSIRLLTTGWKVLRGRIDRDGAKEAFIQVFLAGASRSQVDRWNKLFCHVILPLLLRKNIMKQIQRHQQDGYLAYIVSASLDIYLEPLVLMWGFDGLISTNLEWADEKITGRLLGRNCRGEEKAKRIKKIFSTEALRESHGYGDSHGDRQMMELVNFVHYV